APPGKAPRLLGPMARMLSARQDGRVSLSATSLRTLLDGIASRLDETRETSRYLIGVLVFLGLLGTFYGLLETVRSVGCVITALNDRLGAIGEYLNAGQAQMVRLAENQIELKPLLSRLTTVAENSLGQDEVLRGHLRNIEAYTARLTEDLAEGRAQSVHELRN